MSIILTSDSLFLYAYGAEGKIVAIPRSNGPLRNLADASVVTMAQSSGRIVFNTYKNDLKQNYQLLQSVAADGSARRTIYDAAGVRGWKVTSSSQYVGWSDSDDALWVLDDATPRKLSIGPADAAVVTDVGFLWEPVSRDNGRILRLTDWDGKERIIETLPDDGAGAFGVGSMLLFADRKGFRRLQTGKPDDYLPYGESMARRAGFATDGERLVWSRVTRTIDMGGYQDFRSTVYMAYPARPSIAPVVLLEDVHSVGELAVDARGIAWIEALIGPEYATPILMMADFI